MTRCLNCGSERAAADCDYCGMSPDEAEAAFRRRLLHFLGAYFLGAILFLASTQYFPPLELDAILIFVGSLFFLTLLLAIVLDRGARRHGEIEAWKRIFQGLVPVPWLLGALLFVNGQFDTTPVWRHETAVVGKFTMPGVVRLTRLAVVSWRPSRSIERIPVSRDDFDRFRRGDRVVIQLQEGLVGIPWVAGVSRR